jgi:hypothetical protein
MVEHAYRGLGIEQYTWIIDRLLPVHISLTVSNFTSSFRCRLEGNNGDADDRIIAKPDGALVLITDKKSMSNQGNVIWSLQEAALAFEVLPLSARLIEGETGRHKLGRGIDGQRS